MASFLAEEREREAWLEERSAELVVGSSDAAAILGLSRWETAHTLALRKLGRLAAAEDTPLLRLGRLVEPAVAELYTEQTGRKAGRPACRTYRNPERPWQVASPDFLVEGDGAEEGALEVKLVNPWDWREWGEPGTDQVPEAYLVQVQHQMAVLGLPWCDLAPLVWGQRLRVYRVRRHDLLIERITRAEEAWLDLVRQGKAPEPDWRHSATLAAIQAVYGVEEGKAADLGPAYLPLIQEWQMLGEEEKKAKAGRDAVKARLLDAMGDAALATLPDGTQITRKRILRRAYTVPESEYVDFRIRPKKRGAKDDGE